MDVLVYEEGANVTMVDTSTWTPRLQELVQEKTIAIEPYQLNLDYGYWNHGGYVFQRS